MVSEAHSQDWPQVEESVVRIVVATEGVMNKVAQGMTGLNIGPFKDDNKEK